MATQHGANACQQFARLKGFGQVVVGANFQPDDAIHRVALGGEHEHRRLCQGTRQGANASANLQPVDVGQHQIKQHQGGRQGLQHLQTLNATAGVVHRKTRLGQVFTNHLRQTMVVFNDEQSSHGPMVGGL